MGKDINDASGIKATEVETEIETEVETEIKTEIKTESEIEDIIKLLDDYANGGGSRMKLTVVEGNGGVVSRQYHHGRCDVGSPWAKGEAFDVLE